MNTTKQTNHQDTKSTKPKDLGVLGDLGGSTRPPLPPGWRWVRLGEVCEERTGIRDPRRQPDALFRYVDITSVDNKAKKIVEPKTLLGKDAPSRARQIIRVKDVLVATTRPNLNAVALVPPELDNEVCSTGFCVLRAKPGLNPDFLFAWVQTPTFVHALTELVKGALYPAVTDNQVRAQFIPCRRWRSRSGWWGCCGSGWGRWRAPAAPPRNNWPPSRRCRRRCCGRRFGASCDHQFFTTKSTKSTKERELGGLGVLGG